MNKMLLIGAAAAAFAVATPASASVVLCTGNCVTTDENVLVTTQQDGVPTVTGVTNNTGVDVTFNSSTDALLNGSASGQAAVSSADGLLNSLYFSLEEGYSFATALFNLNPLSGNQLNEATKVIITYFTPGVGMQTQTISTNGNNFIGLSGTAGERFISAGFISDPITSGISDMRQVRLGGVSLTAAVPEPATWAMMLLGFAFLGTAMRRRKSTRRLTFGFA